MSPGNRALSFLLVSAAAFAVGALLGPVLLPPSGRARSASPGKEEKATFWTCGMHPEVIRDQPGTCPRCGIINELPFFGPIGTTTEKGVPEKGVPGQARTPTQPQAEGCQVYKRKGKSWESFLCRCGKLIQLSPAFTFPKLTCASCGKEIQIESSYVGVVQQK
jgi:hypothetical protein